MPELNGTKTHQNLKDAFAGESQANRRYTHASSWVFNAEARTK